MHDQTAPTTEETVDGVSPTPDDGAGRGRRTFGGWVATGVVAAVAIGIWLVLFLTVQYPDPDAVAPPDEPGDTIEERPVSGVDPLVDPDLVVGESARLRDGAVARVLGLEAGVAPVAGSPAPDPGTTLTRVDIELCAGRTELFVDAAFVLGLGADEAIHDPHLGVRDLVTATLPPGGCQRGTVDLAHPDDVDLVAILLADMERTTAARWGIDDSAYRAAPAGPPLASDTEPLLLRFGVETTPLTGGSVLPLTLVELAPEDDATEEGRRVRLEARRCAGTEPVPTGARFWLLQLEDNRFVTAARDGATLTDGELAPDGCDEGTVDFLVPNDASVTAILYTYGGAFEEARWATP